MEPKVNIMLISHSRDIAKGLKALITQIAPTVPVLAIGGNREGGLGTDMEMISEALDGVRDQGHTLIFYDMGSAKMNADLVLELKGLQTVEIVEAPFVEGAYLAAVKASIGKTAQEIKLDLERNFPNFLQTGE